MCSEYSVPTIELLLHHIGKVHGNSNFFLESNGTRCATTFTNFHAYKRHLRKKHREVISNTEATEGIFEEQLEENADVGESTGSSIPVSYPDEGNLSDYSREQTETCESQAKDLNKEVALWILKLKEGRKLTQLAVDEILSDVTELTTNIVSHLCQELHDALRPLAFSSSDIANFDSIFSEDSLYANPFRNLHTQHLQMSYYRKHFNFVVSIPEILL